MTRREIREEIFKLLFEKELTDNNVEKRIEETIKENKIKKEENIEFLTSYVNDIIENEDILVEKIKEILDGWTYERLGTLEKVLLKISFYEIIIKKVGYEIAINEAVELAKKYHCKKIIYISSIQVIGKIKDIPIKETHEKEPLTLYHSTKLFGENYLNNISSIQKVIFRITSPIGKNMPKNKIMRVFVEKSLRNEDIVLLGKGKRVQNYIDVFDIARAIECAIEADNPNGVYNIASPKSISNIELAELCKFLLKSDSKILFNGVDKEEDNKWIVDTSKAEKELGFIAKKSIEESIFEIKEEIMKSENTFSK